MNHIFAIVEREMRKFFRSPALMMASMVFPLVQLIVLGNAFGGKIRDAKLGLVDQDGGTQALKIREAFDSVRANMRTFEPVYYNDPKTAMDDVRNGKIQGAVIIPPQYSRRVYEQDQPRIALVVDNSDNFMSSTLEDELTSITNALNQPTIEPRILQQTVLQIVELYPYIEYMKYLLPGSITLAMFVSVMIGGGMLYIDDKARGVHEGYLVTPITKTELVFGLNAAGAIKAIMTGVVITVIGSLLGGRRNGFQPGHRCPIADPDCAYLSRIQYHDVPAHGSRRRSPRASGDLWNPQYTSFFPQRRDLSYPGVSEVVARHRSCGPIHLRSTRLQVDPAERSRHDRHLARHALSLHFRTDHSEYCHTAVQENPVRNSGNFVIARFGN